jgi:hypothetical protein
MGGVSAYGAQGEAAAAEAYRIHVGANGSVTGGKAEKAARRASAGDLPKSDHLGRLICFDATPILSNFQAAHLARRFGLSATAARIVAQHAFSNGRAT